jgi:hypothetical protein
MEEKYESDIMELREEIADHGNVVTTIQENMNID